MGDGLLPQQPCSVRGSRHTTLGIPALIEACRQRIGADSSCKRKSPTETRDREAPRSGLGQMGRRSRAGLGRLAAHLGRLAMEVWDVIKDEDWC